MILVYFVIAKKNKSLYSFETIVWLRNKHKNGKSTELKDTYISKLLENIL